MDGYLERKAKRLGVATVEMDEALSSITSMLRSLNGWVSELEEMSCELEAHSVHAEHPEEEDDEAEEDDQVEEIGSTANAQDTELVRVLGGRHGFFNLVEELMYYIADTVGSNDLDQVSLMKVIHDALDNFDGENKETDLSLAELYRSYSFQK